jgi:hypothetical protein
MSIALFATEYQEHFFQQEHECLYFKECTWMSSQKPDNYFVLPYGGFALYPILKKEVI